MDATVFLGIFFACIAMITAGSFSFSSKVLSSLKIQKEVINIYLALFCLIIAFIFFLIQGKYTLFQKEMFVIGGLLGFFYSLNLLLRFEVLKYVTTSFYFINYRIFSSILILIGGWIIFGETLSLINILGFFVGFFVFALLFDISDKHANLKRGVFLLLITILLLSATNLIGNFLSLNKNNVINYAFVYFCFYLFFSCIYFLLSKQKSSIATSLKIPWNKKYFLVFLVTSSSFYLSIISFIFAYYLIPISIAYKVLSFSVLIPVLLSAYFYKERITPRVILALALTIISISLFLI